MVTGDDPISFEEAIKSQKWRDAMMKEMESIEKNHTWELTDFPKGMKAIGVKWIFKTKFKENGEKDKVYKFFLGTYIVYKIKGGRKNEIFSWS